MIEVEGTEEFETWFLDLGEKDAEAVAGGSACSKKKA